LTVPSKYLSIDYGLKRVGIAVSDNEKRFSFSRDYLFNDASLISNIFRLLKSENVSKIILGYPLNFKSEKTEMTLEVEKFRELLEKNLKTNSLDTEIVYYDERLTSGIAQHNLYASGVSRKKRHEKGLIDSMSAQIILQDYIDKENNKLK
jgi:putative Holliday junction resolvase